MIAADLNHRVFIVKVEFTEMTTKSIIVHFVCTFDTHDVRIAAIANLKWGVDSIVSFVVPGKSLLVHINIILACR